MFTQHSCHTVYIQYTSEEVVLQLIKSKCVPVLLCGLEACALNKSQMASLDCVVKPLDFS